MSRREASPRRAERISEKARGAIAREIERAQGNEVFFVGRTDRDGTVETVTVRARGNVEEVPAILEGATFGDVLIHNHPSGELTPSAADLRIASGAGEEGVGFLIVDNLAERVYVVVEPFAEKVEIAVAEAEIRRVFSASGHLAAHQTGFEVRGSQVEMAVSVAQAFNGDRVLLTEAGTGTGKSLAYLVPAILWSVRNRERVVISTHTINLQEQLILKDLPVLEGIEGLDFRAVLVKGRGNYLCRRKIADLRTDTENLFEEDEAESLRALLEWAEATGDGTRSDLGFQPREETWEKVACEADLCGRVLCRFYEDCFYYRARRGAARAHVLITNHALLFSDLAVRAASGSGEGSVLPSYSRIVLDEAHHVEDVATEHFSASVSRHGILRLLGRLESQRRRGKGLIPHLAALLASGGRGRGEPGGRKRGKGGRKMADTEAAGLARRLEEHLLNEKRAISARVEEVFDSIFDALAALAKKDFDADGGGSRTVRITDALESSELWRDGVAPRLQGLSAELAEFSTSLRGVLGEIEQIPGAEGMGLESPLVDLKGIATRIAATAATLAAILEADEERVRWFELRKGRREGGVRLRGAPLLVSESLSGHLFGRFPTVVLTSATLTVAGSFQFLKERLGLGTLPGDRLFEEVHPSPFDFDRQMLAALPPGLPDPSSPAFPRAVGDAVRRAVKASHGKALILFTSYRMLGEVHRQTCETIEGWGIRVLKQGDEPRDRLARAFRSDVHSVLFATDSFWEGIDVKGEALELLVIARLPFRVPSEPILEARVEHMRSHGQDPFNDYQLPMAAMKLRQGAGRLIRSRTDRGVVLLLDPRLITKPYGRVFLQSLPTKRILSPRAGEGFWEEVERFFSSAGESARLGQGL